jgi:hypothetical protein
VECYNDALVVLADAREYYDRGGAAAALVPPGVVVAFAGETIPEGWELCDGRSFDGSLPKYKELFKAVGIGYGGKDTQFFTPDCRGMFLEGVGPDARRDRAPATASSGSVDPTLQHQQGSASTSNPQSPDNTQPEAASGGGSQGTGPAANLNKDLQASRDSGARRPEQSEARPKNVNVRFLIRL